MTTSPYVKETAESTRKSPEGQKLVTEVTGRASVSHDATSPQTESSNPVPTGIAGADSNVKHLIPEHHADEVSFDNFRTWLPIEKAKLKSNFSDVERCNVSVH